MSEQRGDGMQFWVVMRDGAALVVEGDDEGHAAARVAHALRRSAVEVARVRTADLEIPRDSGPLEEKSSWSALFASTSASPG